TTEMPPANARDLAHTKEVQGAYVNKRVHLSAALPFEKLRTNALIAHRGRAVPRTRRAVQLRALALLCLITCWAAAPANATSGDTVQWYTPKDGLAGTVVRGF